MLRILILFTFGSLVTGWGTNSSSLRYKSRLYSNNIHEDVRLQVPELVKKYGYPLELHQVTTRDGYILTMHRIPHGKIRNNNPKVNRPAVFLMHGLLSSSADWVLMGPGHGLGYILAEEGFDVWLGNARGNHYSRAHVALKPDGIFNEEFWQFSWEEIGNIDLPTMIDYALKKARKPKLHYIGHSQGTTAFFVMCSLQPKYNKKIISFQALAPVAYLTHSRCPLMRAIAPLSSPVLPSNGRTLQLELQRFALTRLKRFLRGSPICVLPFDGRVGCLLQIMGVGEFLPNSVIMEWAGETLCKDTAAPQIVCSNILYLIGGFNPSEHNATMLPVIIGHTPAGASVRQFVHYGQSMSSKDFRRFDHGWLQNKAVYGSLNPPKYNLALVTAPTYFHYSLSDPLAHVKDVARLWSEIRSPVQKIVVPEKTFSHLDFLWGINAKALVYDKVIYIMKGGKGKLKGKSKITMKSEKKLREAKVNHYAILNQRNQDRKGKLKFSRTGENTYYVFYSD